MEWPNSVSLQCQKEVKYFFDHTGDFRDSICHSSKKILSRRIVMAWTNYCCMAKSKEPNHVMGIDQSVLNVRK